MMNKKAVIKMLDDLEKVFSEIKPEISAFCMAGVMVILRLIAEPVENQTKLGFICEVLMTCFLAVGVASLVRALQMDPNFATFVGTAVGLLGYKAVRRIIIFFFRGSLNGR